MPRKIDFRTYLTLEKALARRLLRDWQKQSGPVFLAITKACNERKWDDARRLVSELDMKDIGRDNREWLKYLLRALAIYGAEMVAKDKPSFVGVGSFDMTLNQVTATILQYLEFGATRMVQQEALQLIAEDEAASKIQKREHEFGNTQIEVPPTSEAGVSLLQAREAISNEDVSEGGKEEILHVTVRYGIEQCGELLRKFLADQRSFLVVLKKVMIFPPSEHSKWMCPVVVEVESPELHALHEKIGDYAQFKSENFPEYKPHITLAYVKPEQAEKYKSLKVGGSFVVQTVTIRHASGVCETIPFGMVRKRFVERSVKKADAEGRYVTPFVSFDNQGDEKLQLIAGLNASRLATWGFMAECEIRGVKQYKMTAVLDGRTSEFCRMIDGKVFEVEYARQKTVEVLNVQNPDDLRNVQPWPKQTKAALEEFKDMNVEDLTARGLNIPPFHPNCRTVCTLVSDDVRLEKPPIPVEQQIVPEQVVTVETMKEIGIRVTQEEVDHWNAYVGLSPVAVLAKLSGKTPEELLTWGLGKKSVQFLADGDIAMNANGTTGGVRYAISTILDPYTGTYYLSQADLVADLASGREYLKRLYMSLIETGQSVAAKSFVIAVNGDALTYVKLGFLPTASDWQMIRAKALDSLESGDLKELFVSLADDQKVLIQHLLMDMDEHVLSAIADLAIEYQGKSLGEWILAGVKGEFTLDLTDVLAAKQAMEYLR